MIDEIIKRVHNLTPDQQKEILDHLKLMQADGQREYSRKETKIEITVVVGDKAIQGDALDISGSGMFIRTREKIRRNSPITVIFSLPVQDRPFKLQGKVVRTDPNGIAIQFGNVSPYFQKVLDTAVWGGE